MLRTDFILATCRRFAWVTLVAPALVSVSATASAEPTVVVRWNQALLEAVKATKASDVITARALAIAHTAMFNAWAGFDDVALGTDAGAVWRRPAAERTSANKSTAVSHAAYVSLTDLFPAQQSRFGELLRGLGHDPAAATRDGVLDSATPAGLGMLAARRVLYSRHHDGANQQGDLREGNYADWTRWRPVNPPDKLVDARLFQPPSGMDAQGQLQVRNFGAAHFALVRPFALATPWEFRPTIAPIQTGSMAEATRLAREVIDISAGLTDQQKATAEFWALDGGSETPPGYWAKLAQFVAERRGHTLDDDVKLFFALGNTMLDAGVATIDAKVAWNGARPEPFIRYAFRGETIKAWGGAGRGTEAIKGEDYKPYLATSASPEHVSGHSAFSAAAATLLKLFTGTDEFAHEVVFPANGLKRDSGPAQDITFRWATFGEAMDSAGWSRVYGGIHFTTGDQYGRKLGEQVALKTWHQVRMYFGTGS